MSTARPARSTRTHRPASVHDAVSGGSRTGCDQVRPRCHVGRRITVPSGRRRRRLAAVHETPFSAVATARRELPRGLYGRGGRDQDLLVVVGGDAERGVGHEIALTRSCRRCDLRSTSRPSGGAELSMFPLLSTARQSAVVGQETRSACASDRCSSWAPTTLCWPVSRWCRRCGQGSRAMQRLDERGHAIGEQGRMAWRTDEDRGAPHIGGRVGARDRAAI